jgi:hypothetical protein
MFEQDKVQDGKRTLPPRAERNYARTHNLLNPKHNIRLPREQTMPLAQNEEGGGGVGDFWPGFLVNALVPLDLTVALRREDMELLLGRGGVFVPPTQRQRTLEALARLALTPPDTALSEQAQERQRRESKMAHDLILELANEKRNRRLAQAMYDRLRGRTPRDKEIRQLALTFPRWSQRRLAQALGVSVGTVNAALR